MRLVLICLFGAAAHAWTHVGQHEFHRAMGGHNIKMIAFVEPSTAASKALEKEWDSLSASEKALISVDCTAESELCREFEVISYPTIRFVDGHGSMSSYRGPRKAASIASYLQRAQRPTISKLNDKKLSDFKSIDDVVIIGRLNPKESYAVKAFEAVADQYHDRASFGSISTQGSSALVCYNNEDDEQVTLSDLSGHGSVKAVTEACLTPLISEFTRRTELTHLQSGKSLVYYLSKDPKERDSYVKEMRPVAKKYKEYLRFLTVDAIEYPELASALGVQRKAFPAVSVQNPMYGQVFPYDQSSKISPERVEQFVMEIAQGNVQPWQPGNQGSTGGKHDEL